MYAIVTPLQFLRQARKFFRKHPDWRSLNPGLFHSADKNTLSRSFFN